jgi:RNase P protein component
LLRELIRAAVTAEKLHQRKVVIVARDALLRKDFKVLQEEFDRCLQKVL